MGLRKNGCQGKGGFPDTGQAVQGNGFVKMSRKTMREKDRELK